MLGTADQQHLRLVDGQPSAGQMPGDGGALMGPSAMGLIAQQGFQIAGGGQLAQGSAEQFGLAGQRRVIEIQVQQT